MCKTLLRAAVFLSMVGFGVVYAANSYSIVIEILGTDGSVASKVKFACPIYEECRNVVPIMIDGNQEKMEVVTRIEGTHHVYVRARGIPSPKTYREPFDSWSDHKAFEAGKEWTVELSRRFSSMFAAKGTDPNHVLARVRMHLED
jgi:hypothetical protein